MSETMTMQQSCPCGARFRAEGPANHVGAQAHSWRENHAAHSSIPVEPGLCWHDSGVSWPTGVNPRCELKAGHAGDRGSAGGSAVWGESS